MTDYSQITDDQFTAALERIIGEHSPAQLLAVPGAYEVLSEYFNNEALDESMGERDAGESTPAFDLRAELGALLASTGKRKTIPVEAIRALLAKADNAQDSWK